MALSTWFRPPRHLIVLFLGMSIVLMGTLGWFGVRLLRQDRALERERVRERLERAADAVAVALQGELNNVDDQLSNLSNTFLSELRTEAADYVGQLSDDAVLVVMDSDGLEAYPSGRLLYYPVSPLQREPGAAVFARGETLEFRERNFSGASRAYERFVQSSDSAIRAGALLRLARVRRKAGDADAAFEAFRELTGFGSTTVASLPAELVARGAILEVLEDAGRADELTAEAESLHADLQSGKWRITRAQYELYASQLCTKIAYDSTVHSPTAPFLESALALAAGAERLWDNRSTLDGNGREVTWFDDEPMLLVWRHSGELTVGLVGGRRHLETDWIGSLDELLEGERIAVSLSDVRGRALTATPAGEVALSAARTAAETRLPWTLHVTSADPPGDFARFAERRRLLLLGLATLALLLLVGLYAVTRGVTRELAVARLQSDFVAAVSHEFRTPLTSLKQLAELLSSGRVSTEERRAHYYQVMERESGRLHRLVEGLLDFGRMEAGALEFNMEKVSVRDLVRGVVTDFEVEIADDSFTVELNEGAVEATAMLNAEALRRAVWNLLDNAVKYSPDCGTVWVDLKRENGRATIAVRDEGLGIPAGELESVFEKFVRGSSANGRGTKGTGIGLAMVRHIVEAHGGEVGVESQVGKGSTFTIVLPVEE